MYSFILQIFKHLLQFEILYYKGRREVCEVGLGIFFVFNELTI